MHNKVLRIIPLKKAKFPFYKNKHFIEITKTSIFLLLYFLLFTVFLKFPYFSIFKPAVKRELL